MSSFPIAPLPLSQAGRAAHARGLRPLTGGASRPPHPPDTAGLLGGNLFGRHALHPSVTEISDPAERGKVVNAAWRRYGTVNSLSLLAVATGWFAGRPNEIAAKRLSGPELRLARAKDVLVAAVAVTGLATFEGMRFGRMAAGGAVPLSDGAHAAPHAT
ncbi:MAG: hypothetical protein M3P50_06745, partial [Actinomycetota bacterium]|nr:hypothetical protein [Actinomycetota bacterium]